MRLRPNGIPVAPASGYHSSQISFTSHVYPLANLGYRGAMDRDAIVIGGGPAGLSAALWLGRYRRRAVVVDAGQQRNRWVESSHGYLGLDGISPIELLERARKDLGRYPSVVVRDGFVRAAEGSRDDFVVDVDGEQVACRRIVLAIGTKDRFPEIANLFEHYGASVFTCPSCDGYEAQNKRVVVIGW